MDKLPVILIYNILGGQTENRLVSACHDISQLQTILKLFAVQEQILKKGHYGPLNVCIKHQHMST